MNMKVIIVTDKSDGNFCGVYSSISKVPTRVKNDDHYLCDEMVVDKEL